MNRPPALVIAFLRLEGLKRIVTALVNSGVTQIYIAVDGPRNSKDLAANKELIAFLDSLKIEGVKFYFWKRENNLGIAVSVLSAIDWFFQFETQGIILEDDLEFDDSFIDFVSTGLEKYKYVDDVIMISGNYFNNSGNKEVHFVRYPQIWGWATWSTSWEQIRKNIPSMGFDRGQISFKKQRAFWNIGVTRVKFGLLDTWDLPLAALMQQESLLCCLPPFNLVSNLGIDEFSTHTTKTTFPIGFPIFKYEKRDENIFNKEVSIDTKYEKFLERKVFKIKNRHSLLVFKHIFLYLKNYSKFKHQSNLINLRFQDVQTPSVRS